MRGGRRVLFQAVAVASGDRGGAASLRLIAVVVGVALVVLGSLWSGHAPPRSAVAYRQQAVQTLDYLRSQTQTARLWVEAVADGDSTHQAVTVALQEAEHDATATADRFAAWDPPPGTDGVRDTVTGLGGDVVEALATLRIAVHRGQWAGLSGLVVPLAALADRLATTRDELTRAGRR